MITTKQILKGVNSPFLTLHKGEGYWYFEYDNPAEEKDVFDTRSVCVMYLKDMDLVEWIAEGQQFVKEMEA